MDDDGEDYECVSVLSSHTQDVKACLWHPEKEVSQVLYHFLLLCINHNVFIVPTSCFMQIGYVLRCLKMSTVRRASSILLKNIIYKKLTCIVVEFQLLVSCSYDNTIKFYQEDADGDDWSCVATLGKKFCTIGLKYYLLLLLVQLPL